MSDIPEDILQDIARSSYADMLVDDERNRAYDQAIRMCVKTLVKSEIYNPEGDNFFKCCDIGTGSGLLSMMIVRAFKEIGYEKFSVTAFEAFEPMAKCAQQVICRAGMLDYITVIPSASDAIDENPLFDLLVAELLDTELIGEGCLATYRHAVESLCSPVCLFVPLEARIYIEPVASDLLFQRHALSNRFIQLKNRNRITMKVPDDVLNCCGLAAIDDMQVSALREGIDFHRISKPEKAFQIKFNDPNSLRDVDFKKVVCSINKRATQPVVVVMWWDITMYEKTSENIEYNDFSIDLEVLSCAPTWARSAELLKRDKLIRDLYKRDVWREHWIQGIYYFGNVSKTRLLKVKLEEGDELPIYAYHDSHSLWFELEPSDVELPANCTCGVHRELSRSQLAFLNDTKEMTKLLNSLVVGKQDVGVHYNGEINFISRPLGTTILVDDAPKWKITFDNLSLLDLSFCDENPWEKIMTRCLDGISIAPIKEFHIKFTQVYFENLTRIRPKAGTCEGFDLTPLDSMIIGTSRIVDKAIESHHLWEYGGKRLDVDHIVLGPKPLFQTRDSIIKGTYVHRFSLPIRKCLFEYRKGWALVFWAEFKMSHTDEIISSGPQNVGAGADEPIQWSRNCKQLVYFMHDFEPTPEEITRQELTVDISMKGPHLSIKFSERNKLKFEEIPVFESSCDQKSQIEESVVYMS